MTQQKLSIYTAIFGVIICAVCSVIFSDKEYALALFPSGIFVYACFLASIASVWKSQKYTEIKWYSCVSIGSASGAFTAALAYPVTNSIPMALVFLTTFIIFIYTFIIGATMINVGNGNRDFSKFPERIAQCMPLVVIMAPVGFYINAGIGLLTGSLGVVCLWSLRDKADYALRNIVLVKNTHRVNDEYMRWQGSAIISCVAAVASILLFIGIGSVNRELVSNDYVIAIMIGVAMFWLIITTMLRMNKIIDENKHMFA